MNTELIKIALAATLLFANHRRGHAQGSFVNLDFENPIPPPGPGTLSLPITNALPGWTGYVGEYQAVTVGYNNISFGASPSISLQGPESHYPVLEGNFSVWMQGSSTGVPGSAAIAQTGRTPQDARSIVFFAQSVFSFQLTFGGHYIPPVVLETTPNYVIIAGDISAFAGQSGELR